MMEEFKYDTQGRVSEVKGRLPSGELFYLRPKGDKTFGTIPSSSDEFFVIDSSLGDMFSQPWIGPISGRL